MEGSGLTSIQDFADAIGADLELRRYAETKEWRARFRGCEPRGRIAVGKGKTAAAALADYVDKIRGTTMIVNSGADALHQRAVEVPRMLKA